MNIERGVVVRGQVVPGTELVRRIPGIGWDARTPAHQPDLRTRPTWDATMLVGHWTGGPIRTGEDAARRTWEAMVSRQRPDGSLMSVSCHLVIGWDGLIWQLADLGVATIHAGTVVNPRSVGVETCWPGTVTQARAIEKTLRARGKPVHPGYGNEHEVRTARGAAIKCLAPSGELLAGWVALAEMLTTLPAELGIVIPRQLAVRPGKTATAKSRGAIEHKDCPGQKLDAAGYLTDALVAAGWAPAP